MKILFLVPALLAAAYSSFGQVYGCTDPLSSNYNPNATINNGSCVYASASVSAETTVPIPDTVDESSGLVVWNSSLYTHNDDTDNRIYRLDNVTGDITQTLTVAGAVNQDWEDIDQDEEYIYIGDFGNNVSGNRTNLKVLRVGKEGLLAGFPIVDEITFTYSDQTNFAATGNNNTDFDCEAMIVGGGYIYLFTKQWISKKTSVYRLPKEPGEQVAQFIGSFNVNGLITGATWMEDQKVVALCGYSGTLSPFIYLLYDFAEGDFFSGNKRKISFSQSFTQIEGIATENGSDFYLSCEHFQQSPFINSTQRLFTVNLSQYLNGYLSTYEPQDTREVLLYPNPTKGIVRVVVRDKYVNSVYNIIDMSGRSIAAGVLKDLETTLDISGFENGTYIITIGNYNGPALRIVKN